MKRLTWLIIIATVILGIAACSGQAAVKVTVTPEAETTSAAVPSSTETTAAAAPSKTAQPTPFTITEGPIPGLLGSEWYDWDKVGVYPRASVVQCGDRIAFQLLEQVSEDDEYEYDSYLAFADPDGSGLVRTKIKDSYDLNYKDGWVYFIYGNDGIYKVKAEGKSPKKVFREDNLPDNAKVMLGDLLLAEGKMYFFEHIQYETGEKSVFMRTGLDGKDAEVLDEFAHSDIVGEFDWCFPSLFYDSGKLYYANTDLENNRFDLYRYDIAANNKTCLAKGLTAGGYFKIAVRGDKVYYTGSGGLRVFTISSGEDEAFAPAKNIGYMDFAFFDRWLLISGDEGLYCYDLESGKLYLSKDVGCARIIVPTRNYLYYQEPDDYPFLYPLTFKDGGVTQGDAVNTAG